MLQHTPPPRSPRPAGVGGALQYHHHPRPPRYRLRQAVAFVAGAAVLLIVQKLAESGRRLGNAEVRKDGSQGSGCGLESVRGSQTSGLLPASMLVPDGKERAASG